MNDYILLPEFIDIGFIDGAYILKKDIPKLKKWLIEYEMNNA